MHSHPELTHFAGFDWACDHHDVVIIDKAGTIIETFRFEHTALGWQRWCELIAPYPKLGVAIETSYGAVIDQLLNSAATVFPINPKSAKRYRERKNPAGNKTDQHDAWSMGDALRTDGHAWRALSQRDPIIERLRILSRDEVALIEERTALICQARQAAREYYPTALEAFDDWTAPSAWAFIERFSDAAALLKAGPRAWQKFLHTHKLYRSETAEKRLEIFAQAGQWQIPEHVIQAKRLYLLTKIKQLKALEVQLEIYRRQIEQLFSDHPDSDLFGSLPGAGSKIAPRLLAEIGSDRSLYEDANGLQCISGTTPVSYQSGKLKKVQIRRACNKHLRQTMHLFSNLSRQNSPWAAAYYQTLKTRGKTHSQALRSLGQRWLSIIYRMWQNSTPDDSDLHTRNQIKHGSWVLAQIPNK